MINPKETNKHTNMKLMLILMKMDLASCFNYISFESYFTAGDEIEYKMNVFQFMKN